MELKLLPASYHHYRRRGLNRTFMELKLHGYEHSYHNNVVFKSHLYGIEITFSWRRTARSRSLNRTFMELKLRGVTWT